MDKSAGAEYYYSEIKKINERVILRKRVPARHKSASLSLTVLIADISAADIVAKLAGIAELYNVAVP